ncbi:MAG: hypothetical protein EOO90_08550 [Pedobacter sp.]|nr:MAG: hypothetical protein EOO90_08550 [Pedobacter sp.]
MKKISLFITFFNINLVAFAQLNPTDSLRNLANSEYPFLYKENSEMSYTSPFGEIGAKSKYILNGRLTTTYMILASERLPIAFSLNPDFTARVRHEKSAAVRTPSFKLGGTIYLRLSPNIVNYHYLEIAFTHHSNGQDGRAKLDDGAINVIDGNFNTNYLTASYRFAKFLRRPYAKSDIGLHQKISLQWHKWFAYEPVLEGDYGFSRVNYELSTRFYDRLEEKLGREKLRLVGTFSYAINKFQRYTFFSVKRRLNAELGLHYALPFMQNSFLMSTLGYYGEDPYNIYFKDRYAFLRLGISSTFTKAHKKNRK